MKKEGLEDCPFCGNDKVTLEPSALPADVGIAGYAVKCGLCLAVGPHGDIRTAKGQWNCWLPETEREIMKKNGAFYCGYEKLSEEGKAEHAKLMKWLEEQAEIEKKFKHKSYAWLCRDCSAKTKYTHKNYGCEPKRTSCEMCGDDPETTVGLNSHWEDASLAARGKK